MTRFADAYNHFNRVKGLAKAWTPACLVNLARLVLMKLNMDPTQPIGADAGVTLGHLRKMKV